MVTKEGELTMNKLINIDEMKCLVSDNKITLLYISSERCEVCKVILPRLVEMLESYPLVAVMRADIEELPLLSGEYSVFTIPCVLVFVEGKEVFREARYISLEQLNEQVDRYYTMLYKE